MNNYKFRMSKLEMAMNCTAGYHKSLEIVNESSEAADDGTGTHHLIDTCFKFGFKYLIWSSTQNMHSSSSSQVQPCNGIPYEYKCANLASFIFSRLYMRFNDKLSLLSRSVRT
jgi:hypothetical protein